MINTALEERRLRMENQPGCAKIASLAKDLTAYIHAHTETRSDGQKRYVGDFYILIQCQECYELLKEKEDALDIPA
ncbi:hypothetical protein GOV07_05175 [Candidatus Woesearchaeota archaeon]|nr:hypothetical protein [Candidatus Woesearchaeota archaeon]